MASPTADSSSASQQTTCGLTDEPSCLSELPSAVTIDRDIQRSASASGKLNKALAKNAIASAAESASRFNTRGGPESQCSIRLAAAERPARSSSIGKAGVVEDENSPQASIRLFASCGYFPISTANQAPTDGPSSSHCSRSS